MSTQLYTFHYFIFISSIVLINPSISTKSFKEKMKSFQDTMDMTLCNSIYQLTRFFYESNKNIFRNNFEISEILTPIATEEIFSNPNKICSGSGSFFTNRLKKEKRNMNYNVNHHFEWLSEEESNSFSEKYLVKIECPQSKFICLFLLDMLKGNDLDLDIGHYNIGNQVRNNQNGASIEIVLLKYITGSLLKQEEFLLI